MDAGAHQSAGSFNLQTAGRLICGKRFRGAVVLSASEEPGVLAVKLHADGSHGDILCGPTNPTNAAFGAISSQANTPRRVESGLRLVW